MKKIIIIMSTVALMITSLHAQSKIMTKTGSITFEASVPSFEEVKATNENVSAILNTETGEFAALALMKGFRFKVALMEEHFNENYVESSTYPKAVFKGTISNFDLGKISPQPTEFNIQGSITMHGETKEVDMPIQLLEDGSSLLLTTNFTLKPSDFNIKIPSVVSKKIAENIDVSVDFKLSK